MKKYDHILFCGDIHGDLDIIPNYLRDNSLKNCAVVQLGDFGIGFELEKKEKSRLKYLNNRMKYSNSDLFVIRGNHDNPHYFNGEYDVSNINLVKDYSVVKLNSLNILCVGGAISVDRKSRKGYLTWSDSMQWWIKEEFVYDYDKIIKFKNIDIVATHTSPNISRPYHSHFTDRVLNSDIENEGELVYKMFNNLSINNNIKKWYYGHFHISYEKKYENTTFQALDINEIVEVD